MRRLPPTRCQSSSAILVAATLLAASVSLAVAAVGVAEPNTLPPIAAEAVASKAGGRATLFDLADVRLGPGPFRDAMERDNAYLLLLEPDRLLHTFRLNVNLPSAALPYGDGKRPRWNFGGTRSDIISPRAP